MINTSPQLSNKSAMVRTLAVWCPDWPITAAGYSPETSAVVLKANRVLVCSTAARAEGIKRGIRKREAQSKNPEVEIINNDPARDAREFERVVSAVYEFSSHVEIIRPGLCVLATRGPSRYFGGENQLVGSIQAKVSEVLSELNAVCQVGIADGPFAAQLAAKQCSLVPENETPEFLSPHSITALENEELTDVLIRLGIDTLGKFAALPSADVLARFGNEGAYAQLLAKGEDTTTFTGTPPPDDWSVEIQLDGPMESLDELSFVGNSLAEKLYSFLDDKGMGCNQMAVEAQTDHGESISRTWRTEVSMNVRAMRDRVRWQLDGWINGNDKNRPTSGVVLLRLVPEKIIPNDGIQKSLWGGERESDQRVDRALTRIQALVGHQQVATAVVRGSRTSAEQIELIPWGDAKEKPQESQPWPGSIPKIIPSTVYVTPMSTRIIDENGNYVSISGRGLISSAPTQIEIDGRWKQIKAWAGPWPVDERWWDKEAHHRQARLQVVTTDGKAWLITVAKHQWRIEAGYE